MYKKFAGHFLMKNQIKIYKKLSQSGVGIVELMISAVLLGFLALAVTKLGVDTWRFQTESVTASEVNEFSSSLGYFFKGFGCSGEDGLNEFRGKDFPGTAPEDLTIEKYVGWGETGDPIGEGFEFADGKWEVHSLTWKHKDSIDTIERKRRVEEPPDSGTFVDKTYEIKVAQISLQLKIKRDGIDGSSDDGYTMMTPYNVEIPFVVDPGSSSGKEIVDCVDPNLDGQDICAVIGAEYNEEENRCDPNENCFIKTSFVNCQTHRPGKKPWRDEDEEKITNLCDKLIKKAMTEGGEKRYVSFHNKDLGHTPGECPPDSDGILSGDVRRDQRYRCGKKCTDTAYGAGEIYLCMECPEGSSGGSTGSSGGSTGSSGGSTGGSSGSTGGSSGSTGGGSGSTGGGSGST